MNFKKGDLVYYRSNTAAIILKFMFSDNSDVKYFSCLIGCKEENVCELWLTKI